MRILGIDPGSVRCGVGVVDLARAAPCHVHHRVVAVGSGAFPARLKLIFEEISALIHEYQPDEVAIESVFMSRNADSALKLGQARGAAICAAVAMNRPVAEYAPSQVKQAIVGRGAAAKRQIQHMIGVLLGVPADLPEDAADALGVAVCHAHHVQSSVRMPSGVAAAAAGRGRRRRR